MYNKESVIFDINMITKLISYILFIILDIINNNIFLFLLIEIIILIEARKEKWFLNFNKISVIFFLICLFLPELLIIPKILIIVSYTYLLTKVVNINQLRYLIEISFYKYKNNKLTKLFLSIMYYFKYIKVYIKKYINIQKEHGFHYEYNHILYTIKKANQLASNKIKKLIQINEIRFYNYHNKKTYLEEIEFEFWDYIYLIIHFLLLIIAVFTRR